MKKYIKLSDDYAKMFFGKCKLYHDSKENSWFISEEDYLNSFN